MSTGTTTRCTALAALGGASLLLLAACGGGGSMYGGGGSTYGSGSSPSQAAHTSREDHRRQDAGGQGARRPPRAHALRLRAGLARALDVHGLLCDVLASRAGRRCQARRDRSGDRDSRQHQTRRRVQPAHRERLSGVHLRRRPRTRPVERTGHQPLRRPVVGGLPLRGTGDQDRVPFRRHLEQRERRLLSTSRRPSRLAVSSCTLPWGRLPGCVLDSRERVGGPKGAKTSRWNRTDATSAWSAR